MPRKSKDRYFLDKENNWFFRERTVGKQKQYTGLAMGSTWRVMKVTNPTGQLIGWSKKFKDTITRMVKR
jgi:hypothetical protein